MNDHIDDFTDLLGAYALDAVDPDERRAIEDHLATCPRCRAEVAEHREVASFLSHSGAPAPEGVWDRIAAELAPPAPPLRMTFSRDGEVDPLAGPVEGPASESSTDPAADPMEAPVAPVLPFDRMGRRGVRTRTFVAVVSAAAAVVAILGFITISQSRRLDRTETATENGSVTDAATRALGHSALKVPLKGKRLTAEAVVDRSGHGYLFADGLPAPHAGHVYQLWGKVGGTVLSLGTFGGHNQIVPFQLDANQLRDVQLFAVTEEKGPGVVASTQPALVAGTT